MAPDIEPPPRIGPMRMTATDIASLTAPEVYGILLLLAGHEDPAVAAAVIDCTRRILERTRGGP